MLFLHHCCVYLRMAILERKIVHGVESSFSHMVYPRFVLPRHRHAEFELMVITAGSGKVFVGEAAADYTAGDLMLIGSNIPHLHLCNTVLSAAAGVPSSGEALQFPLTIFPDAMSSIPEYARVARLLDKSRQGLRFRSKELAGRVVERMHAMDHCAGVKKLVVLLDVLDVLAHSSDYCVLSEVEFGAEGRGGEMGRGPTERVCAFLVSHFRERIELGRLADVAGMNPAALCRAFRQRTDKSIFRYLCEMRIEYACKLLAHSDLTVSQIAYESGYNNLSHFNRQFREVMRRTPSEYRLQINAAVR